MSSKTKYVCKYCGKIYLSYKEKSNYCSRECRNAANTFYYNCEYCGKEMKIPRYKHEGLLNGTIKHVYCSKECTDKAHTTKVTKICEYCGEEYQIWPCFENMQRFCSMDCYNKYRVKKYICPVCGEEFDPKYSKQVFCSDKCRDETDDEVVCNCDYCGNEIVKKRLEYYGHKKHYCSTDCWLNDIRWNEKDLEILRKYYKKEELTDIQKRLSKWRSEAEIYGKARKIGLSDDYEWKQEELDILYNQYGSITVPEIQKLLPGRSYTAIIAKALSLNIESFYSKTHFYSAEDVRYLQENYLYMTNAELGQKLHRSETGIEQELAYLELYRPKDANSNGYNSLVKFTRSKLQKWRNEVLSMYDCKCALTGSEENLVVHHIRSFNLIFEETIEALDFPEYEDFSDYTEEQLRLFIDTFLNIQEYYHQYICITEDIHKMFHQKYGYGYNTQEQWDDFVANFDSQQLKTV